MSIPSIQRDHGVNCEKWQETQNFDRLSDRCDDDVHYDGCVRNGIGYNVPHEEPKAFVKAIVDADEY